ncbi:hypothetical protein EC968_002740 [Mortierella alpina]|nr:hypothetical protein EC968_002740 [Mortierella alpina]
MHNIHRVPVESYEKMLQLNKDVNRIRLDISNKGRSWFRAWRKPKVYFKKIWGDIAAIDTELMVILRYDPALGGRPPSVMEVIKSAGLKREFGPQTSEQFVGLHVRLLEESSNIPGGTSVTENVAPQRRQPRVTGYEHLDPCTVENYRRVFAEYQQRIRR